MQLNSAVKDATEANIVVEVEMAIGVASEEIVAAVVVTTRAPERMSLDSLLRLAKSPELTEVEARIVVATEVAREAIEVVTVVPERAPEVATAHNRRVRPSLPSRASLLMTSERERKKRSEFDLMKVTNLYF